MTAPRPPAHPADDTAGGVCVFKLSSGVHGLVVAASAEVDARIA